MLDVGECHIMNLKKKNKMQTNLKIPGYGNVDNRSRDSAQYDCAQAYHFLGYALNRD